MVLQHTVPEIVDSWKRCINQYKLGSGKNLEPPRLTAPEIRLAQEEFKETFHSATPIIHRLAHFGKYTSGGGSYKVHVADVNGTLLEELSDVAYSDLTHAQALAPGSVLVEEQVGTNGAGTCLATGQALTVYDDEHFSSLFHGLACSGAPLISPFGEVVGTLSLASQANGCRAAHIRDLQLACDTAAEIEATVFRNSYANYHIINLTRADFPVPDSSVAMLAVNDSGWVIGVTTAALPALKTKQRDQLIGQSLSILSGQTLDALYTSKYLPLLSSAGGHSGWHLSIAKVPVPVLKADRKTKTLKPEETQVYKVAGTDARAKRNAEISLKMLDKGINILLMGETGTGKEVWARAIHDSSIRRDKPFVTLNCAAIPESLIESELFGYSGGTFTGGLKRGKVGKIEASHGGTLFLDEIGDMPLLLQARLLRVLAEGEVTPLGQLEPIKVDLNVVCATHRDLISLVGEGIFREDLYYRISGVNLKLPPLRERSDRQQMIDNVLADVSGQHDINIDNYAMAILSQYQWPGNFRQLKNVLHFAVSMCNGKTIRILDLPEELFIQGQLSEPQSSGDKVASEIQHETPEQNEREKVLAALEEHRWVVARAAKALGISRSTMHRKIKAFNLDH